jgi:copper oxidase (laccase) domain-containing protein
VIERAVEALRSIGHGDVHAVLGPCIHPTRYEFGARDVARLVERLGPELEARTAHGTPALDLPAGVRNALTRAGVRAIDDVDICTATSPGFFSHRRDGRTGRQALLAVLVQ